MLKALPLLALLVTVPVPPEGKTMQIRGRGYSFSITEPEGWTIDFRSAAQLANFVMHPKGTIWREAPVVVFARLARKHSKETLQTFVGKSLDDFRQSCPFYDIQETDLELKGSRKFVTRVLLCPGVRHEIVAVTEAPTHFVTFVLSSSAKEELSNARDPFRQLLGSFRWISQPPTPQE